MQRLAFSRVICFCGIVLMLVVAAGCLGRSDTGAEGAPPLAIQPTGVVATAEKVLPTQGLEPPAIQEQRLLVLEWPEKIRLGDGDVIRLSLEMDESGSLTPTVEIPGHTTSGQPVQIPNLYATHSVQAQARLDISGMNVSPQNTLSQSLLPGERVTFYWSVRPEQVGTYRGTVWFGLRFLPRDGGAAIEKAVSAQLLEIQCTDFFGLSGTAARIAGGIGMLVSSLLGWEEIINFARLLIKRLVKKPPGATP